MQVYVHTSSSKLVSFFIVMIFLLVNTLIELLAWNEEVANSRIDNRQLCTVLVIVVLVRLC